MRKTEEEGGERARQRMSRRAVIGLRPPCLCGERAEGAARGQRNTAVTVREWTLRKADSGSVSGGRTRDKSVTAAAGRLSLRTAANILQDSY